MRSRYFFLGDLKGIFLERYKKDYENEGFNGAPGMKQLIKNGDCLTCFNAFSSILANQVLEKYFGCRVAEPVEIENARDSGLDFRYSVVDLGLLLCHSRGPNKYFIKTLEPWIKMDLPVVLPYHCLSAARLKGAQYEIQIELKNSDGVVGAPVFKIPRGGLAFLKVMLLVFRCRNQLAMATGD